MVSNSEMILNIYFSELVTAYEAVTQMRTEVNNIAAEHKSAYDKGNTRGERFVQPFHNAQMRLQQCGEKFKSEIARCARSA